MIASSGSALVLIVDHDLAFLMWLGEVFTELGYQAVPALHCRQGLAMAKRFEIPIATLVINPELRGAKPMVKALAAANPGIRVVMICNPNTQSSAATAEGGVAAHSTEIRAGATLERPLPCDQISREDWLAKVRRTLATASAQ